MADQVSTTTDEVVEMINNDEKDQTAAAPVTFKPDATAQLQALSGLSGLMQNPEILAALQDKLGSMVGGSSGYIQSLPKVVKRRIKALKKLQNEMITIESKFYEEVHELECKYAAQYAPLYEKRTDVVGGNVEPTDSDCEWPSDEEDDEDEISLAGQMKSIQLEGDGDKAKDAEKTEGEEAEEKPEGVPSFWLTIFKNVDMLAEMVQEHDEPILENLTDLQVTFSQSNPMGFTLHFHFSTNDFFTNSLLTKSYVLRSTPDETDPFSFEGPEIIKCEGCKIDWKKGKNVTVKVIKKVQKHQSRGTRRTVTKTVQNDSFFNFFSPPEVTEGEEADEDTEALLAADFEIGHFLRERIIPRAVLYFTGEALEDDDYDDEEEEGDEEGEDDEGEYDEENDPDFVAP